MDGLKIKIINSETIDYDFDNGNPSIVSDKEQLSQALYLHIKQNRGQWVFDLNFGMPYLNQINKDGIFDKKTTSKEKIESEINKILNIYKSEIKKYEYIKSEININNRVYSATINLYTIYGNMILEV